MFGLFDRLFRPNAEREVARSLYADIVRQARQPAFYTALGVPDTPTGRFDLLALHGFLVLQRLRADPAAKAVARSVAETLVEDIDHNLREMGEGDLAVGKKVKSLTQGAYGRMEAYLAALDEPDPAALEAVLLRNLYAERSPGPAILGGVAGYVRRETVSLAGQPTEALMAGNVRFGPPPAPEAA
ncbi:MAG: ubiquinol-cytochrome C chaperone family protein [Alphaproteobacteria bacterium]